MLCATGGFHTITLSNEGTAYCFGKNGSGQLGLGENTHDVVSVPSPIPNFPKITQISCGYTFTACVDEEGILWSFGDNQYGQLGPDCRSISKIPHKLKNVPPVKTIACGAYHLLMITKDEELWSIGRNDYGQLCIGNNEIQTIPQQTQFSNVAHISAGAIFSLFKSNDKVYGCGCNRSGQLGLKHWEDTVIPEAIPNQPNIVQFSCGYSHALFLDIEGNVFTAGAYQQIIQIGSEQYKPNQNVLTQLQNLPTIVFVSAVCNSNYLLDYEGNVWNFGGDGKLAHNDGISHDIPKKVEYFMDIKQISCGYSGHHFLARDSQGKIFVAGNNMNGQLGTGDTVTDPIPRVLPHSLIWGDALTSRAKSARK